MKRIKFHLTPLIADKFNDHKNGQKQQVDSDGLTEKASEYRRDIACNKESWCWLGKQLEPGLRASDKHFLKVTVEDVVTRNKA